MESNHISSSIAPSWFATDGASPTASSSSPCSSSWPTLSPASKSRSPRPVSLRALSQLLLSSAQLLLKPVQQAPALATAGTARTCTNTQLSCHNTSAVADTCCFNQPGGQLLLTQFWDTAPATGPVDSWTVHGLWPDRCDGTYESYCDRRRRYDDIGATIHDEEPRLFEYMSVYWKDYKGDDEQLWEHEWNKHGTCISTLEPRCYDAYTPREEMVDYFRRTMELFRGLDTYQTLASAGITPDNSVTYTSAEIQAALSRATGKRVTIGCKSGQLKEVWYHFNVRGSVQTGEFVATDPDASKSTCPRRGIKYLPKD